MCKVCDNKRHSIWRKANPENGRQYQKAYRLKNPLRVSKWYKRHSTSIKGIATRFRFNYGYTQKDSLHLAKLCIDDFSRCVICGIPGYWLRTQKIFMRGTERMNRRLQPDHIKPFNGKNSTLKNTRILCHSCNDIRKAALFTDTEIFKQVMRWYQDHYSLKILWWLGPKGTLFRNDFMRRKAEKLTGRVFND
jgi:hypothetical protein